MKISKTLSRRAFLAGAVTGTAGTVGAFSSGQVDLQPLVTDILPLGEAGKGFEQMKLGGDVLKVLLDCQSG